MKVPTLQAALGTALIIASAQHTSAHLHGHGHRRAHQLFTKWHGQSHRDLHQSRAEQSAVERGIEKRAACTLPDDPDLVAVPGEKNGGFAMAPDRACLSGSYCPYACKPGKVMAQWKEGSRVAIGSSMDGGLYCDGSTPKKPFKDKPMCIDGTGSVAAQNDCGSVVCFCQTIFPGDEGMYIPSEVSSGSSLTLAVPDYSYWQGTSAHYYVNAPGVDRKEGCIWGTSSKAVGNWAAYVAGANTVLDGNTFVTLGWNPKYMDDFPGKMPTYGLKIECSGNCVGSCEINPSKGSYGAVISGNAGQGDAGNKYCVVTVPKGSSAKIKVFSLDGNSAGPGSKAKESDKSSDSSSEAPSTSSSSASPSPAVTSTSIVAPTMTSTLSILSSSSPSPSISAIRGGVFHENGTETSKVGTGSSARISPTPSQTFNVPTKIPEPTTNRNDGTQPRHSGAAIAGLVVALVASLWLC